MVSNILLLSLAMASQSGPSVQVWTYRDDGSVYYRGEQMRVYGRVPVPVQAPAPDEPTARAA